MEVNNTNTTPKPNNESVRTKLSDKVIAILQRQYKHELNNEKLYLSMVNYCNDKQYQGFKKFYEKQSKEEGEHAEKFGNYLIDKKVSLPVPETEKFEVNYNGLVDLFMKSLIREKLTTDMIKEIANVCMTEKDFQTFELAMEFLKLQHNEETEFINLMDRWRLLADCPSAEFLMDSEINK